MARRGGCQWTTLARDAYIGCLLEAVRLTRIGMCLSGASATRTACLLICRDTVCADPQRGPKTFNTVLTEPFGFAAVTALR